MNNRDSFEDIIERNRLSMVINKVSSNPVLGREQFDEELEHYRCQISRSGEQMDIYLSTNPSDDHITPSDVLLMLAMDASGCQLLEGFDEYRHEWNTVFGSSGGNAGGIEEFWEEYTGRCKQAEALRYFLGEAVYNELLQQFDLRGPLM